MPPIPSNDDPNSLAGTDTNNNGVRDDLEHYIYNEITKDPKIFKAYINHTESMQAMMVNHKNKELIRKYAIQAQNDGACIAGLFPEFSIPKEAKLFQLIANTKSRQMAEQDVARKMFELDLTNKLKEKKEKLQLCRN